MPDMATEKKARSLLLSAGLYRTASRVQITSVLLKANQPLSESQLAARISTDKPDNATVYRTLQKLCDAALVHRAFMQERTWYYELAHNCGKVQCHPHFTCSKCGTTNCLTDTSIPLVNTPKGYRIHRQQVRLEGLCPDCV
jgi:Fur family ferric uptake transcriptional regulator